MRIAFKQAGRWGGALICAGLLVGCAELVPQPDPDAGPLATPLGAPDSVIRSVPPAPPSEASLSLARYYTQLESDLLARGLLRTDGGANVAVDAAQLADIFAEIALRDEHADGQATRLARAALRPVRRWASPVRVSVTFGSAVPEARRRADRLFAARTVTRLARVTGHAMTITERDPNFHLFIVGKDDRDMLLARVQALVPGLSVANVALLSQMPRFIHCLVISHEDPTRPNVHAKSIAVIRAELPDRMRHSCYHEEIAQGLGLPNDSPQARPSVFNDDDEFALLTHLDEDLLRILYNPGLQAGMRPAQARQRARAIAEALKPAAAAPTEEG